MADTSPIIEVKYKSNGIALNHQPFLTVKQADNYYEYSERAGIDSIAFILFDNNTEKFGLINETKPPLYERNIRMLKTAFGGSIDLDLDLIDIVKTEVIEEAGYDVDISKISYIGKTFVSTQMNQFCSGYLVDVTGLKPTETEASTSEKMKDNHVVWMDVNEMFTNSDWKSIWIFSTAVHLDILRKVTQNELTVK